MRGDVVTLGSSCGINGCQRVTVTHIAGGDMSAVASLVDGQGMDVDIMTPVDAISVAANAINPDVSVNITPKDNDGLTTVVSLVCETSQGGWEYLMVKEGEIVLIDGERVMVRRASRTN